jgi:hypothetical protein
VNSWRRSKKAADGEDAYAMDWQSEVGQTAVKYAQDMIDFASDHNIKIGAVAGDSSLPRRVPRKARTS